MQYYRLLGQKYSFRATQSNFLCYMYWLSQLVSLNCVHIRMQAVQEGMGTLFLQWTVGSEHVRYSGGSEIIGIDFEYECPYQWVGQNQSETFFFFFFYFQAHLLWDTVIIFKENRNLYLSHFLSGKSFNLLFLLTPTHLQVLAYVPEAILPALGSSFYSYPLSCTLSCSTQLDFSDAITL